MRIVVIDTSYQYSFSIGLIDDNKSYSVNISFGDEDSFSLFWKGLEGLFSLCGVEKRKVDAVSVSIGPGPFTSLRNGVSVARTLSQVLSIPIIPFSLVEVLEEHFSKLEPTLIFDGRAKKILIKKFGFDNLELVKISDFNPSNDEFLVSVGCKKIFEGTGIVPVNFEVVPFEMVSKVILKKLNLGLKKDFNEVLPFYYKSL